MEARFLTTLARLGDPPKAGKLVQDARGAPARSPRAQWLESWAAGGKGRGSGPGSIASIFN